MILAVRTLFFDIMLLISELSTKVDCGDYVIVTNSRNVKVTGKKDQQLLFRKHSMFPGGLKETPYRAMMVKKPDEVRFSLIALALVRPSTSFMVHLLDYTTCSVRHVTQE
jgi:hypothetical protein